MHTYTLHTGVCQWDPSNMIQSCVSEHFIRSIRSDFDLFFVLSKFDHITNIVYIQHCRGDLSNTSATTKSLPLHSKKCSKSKYRLFGTLRFNAYMVCIITINNFAGSLANFFCIFLQQYRIHMDIGNCKNYLEINTSAKSYSLPMQF